MLHSACSEEKCHQEINSNYQYELRLNEAEKLAAAPAFQENISTRA